MVSRYEMIRDEDQRIQFGLTRTRLLKGLMHYVQDCDRTDDPMIPNIITFDEINKAIDNNWSRNIFIPLSTANMTVATPLKFEKEKNWTNWISSFEPFLRVIPGSTRIPLQYVIMEDTISTPTEYDTFRDETVVKAPLTGSIFHASSVDVYRHLISLIACGPAENWLRASDLAATIKSDGHKAIIVLRLHYVGSGYSSCMIGEATKLDESLHYRNERSMIFSRFTTKIQHMVNLYRDHDTAVSNDAKLRLLFKKIISPALVNYLVSLEL